MTPQKFKVTDSDQSYSLSLALSNLQAHTFTLFLASDTVWSLTELWGSAPCSSGLSRQLWTWGIKGSGKRHEVINVHQKH